VRAGFWISGTLAAACAESCRIGPNKPGGLDFTNVSQAKETNKIFCDTWQ